jgi:hypothetical protein
MQAEIDILENDILEKYPEVLDILLRDHTTQQNIFWATNNYQELGTNYKFSSPILTELITGENGHIIMPRVDISFIEPPQDQTFSPLISNCIFSFNLNLF